MQVNQTGVLGTVQLLVGCLVAAEPALDCQLAKQLMALTGPPNVPKYVGILGGLADEPQDPAAVKDASRFLWNFLAGSLNIGPAKEDSGEAHLSQRPVTVCQLHAVQEDGCFTPASCRRS